jgi:hypothetical protein
VHLGMSSLELREGGAKSVMRDMRYMWSEIDSPLFITHQLDSLWMKKRTASRAVAPGGPAERHQGKER